MRGGSGNDFFSGDEGDDVILGGPGNDHLAGYEGDDSLRGGSGSDTIDYRLFYHQGELNEGPAARGSSTRTRDGWGVRVAYRAGHLVERRKRD